MQSTITDRFSEKQARISRHQTEACSRYPELWSKLIAEWNSPGFDDKVWLTYSANYLFRTNNIQWAIDPLALNWRIKEAPKVNAARDLSNLSFVLLTHRHKDHLDLDLLSALRHLSIIWIVPEFLLPLVMKEAGLPRDNIITSVPLKPIELNGISIIPFHGLHWEITSNGAERGVPSVGYLIEYNGKRWLFPGDTRTYDVFQLPDFGLIDHLFAHLWLGRGCALLEKPPLMDAFCQFCLDLKPRRIALAHLNEFGRDADDLWDESHAQKIRQKFQAISSEVSVKTARMGESILL
ncbi:MAG TPA: MBL fold metallo-hydrolase [Anaerolineales bacterium]|nr:MBL fold metallo-hydrolase [Anaerolineales bacterium]